MPRSYADLTSLKYFPPFANCPLDESTSLEATISTSPTYICKDRNGMQFAVTVRLPPNEIKEGIRGGGFDVTTWKRGWCLAIPRAKRSGVESGKQGFVIVKKDDVLVFPTSVQRLIEICQAQKENDVDEGLMVCQACGAKESSDKLRVCRGCEAVWYCHKECQVSGWNQKGHKSECKVFKALKRLPVM